MKAELCDVHDVVGAALHQLGEAARSHAISVTIAPDLPLVPMDDVLIVQVLVNLLDNALKYSPADAPVEIEARVDAGQLEIRVLDRGRGIPEQELERVFDKFFRVARPGSAQRDRPWPFDLQGIRGSPQWPNPCEAPYSKEERR